MSEDAVAEASEAGTERAKSFWPPLLAIVAVFGVLYGILGYAGGYGRVVDGELVAERLSLAHNMMLDYGRDGGEWTFGYFIPLAIAVLAYLKRREILSAPLRPALIGGGILLVFGFLLFWAGYRGEQKYFGYAAGQILVAGTLLWFCGWRFFGRVFWLWALLGMIWPWRFLIGKISSPLQVLMAKMTTGVLQLVGVGAKQNGSSVYTDTPDPVTGQLINLDVDVACSGIRSFFALACIGLAMAFYRLESEWKRIVLVALVPAITVAANFVRMITLYVGSRQFGTDFAIGEGHDMSGYHLFAGLLVFVVALILMSLLVAVMQRGRLLPGRRKLVRKSVQSNKGGGEPS